MNGIFPSNLFGATTLSIITFSVTINKTFLLIVVMPNVLALFCSIIQKAEICCLGGLVIFLPTVLSND